MKLYLLVGCPFCELALLAASAAGVEVETVTYANKYYLKTQEYLAINPNGTAPALVTEEGILAESYAIMRYFARLSPQAGLFGTTDFQAAQVDVYLSRLPALRSAMFPIFLRQIGKTGFAPDAQAVKDAKKKLFDKLKEFNTELSLKTYLVGNGVTLADIVALSFLIKLFTASLSQKELLRYPNVVRYYRHLVQLPFFTQVFGQSFVQRELEKAFPLLTPQQYEEVQALGLKAKQAVFEAAGEPVPEN